MSSHLGTNSRNPGVPPSFCSISAEQRAGTGERTRWGAAHPAVGRNPEAQESFVAVWLPKPSVFSIAQVG